MKMPEEKTATPDQLYAAAKAIAANPKIKIALDALDMSVSEFAANAEATLERLAEIKKARG